MTDDPVTRPEPIEYRIIRPNGVVLVSWLCAPGREFDWEYSRHGPGNWAPSPWKRQRRDPDGTWVTIYEETGKPTVTEKTNDPVARLKAGLGADEARADAMSHFTVHEQPYYSCAASRTEPLGDLEWGPDAPCDCFLAKRKARALREVAAKRVILAEHEPEPWGEPHPELLRCTQGHGDEYWMRWPCVEVRALADIYGDDDAREVNRG